MFTWLLDHSPLLYFTQSLWRDEAFSILVAQRPLSFFFTRLGFEPPLYYTLLHIWIKLFGTSEIAARSLSLLGFSLATVVVIYWAEKLFAKHWLSWFLPLFFFFNPMLLYYAFEVRTYGWYILFAILTLYAYVYKRWPMFVFAGVLGFYTHTYILVLLFVLGLHWLIASRKRFAKDPGFRSFLATAVFIAPWLWRVLQTTAKLKDSWYFPVNWNLVRSVLGNMFIGYEGTPWFGWQYTRWLSAFLLILFLLAVTASAKAKRARNGLFFLVVTVPLALVIGISFFKPLFVNRYLIPVTVAQVFLVVFAIETIRKPLLQYLAATVAMLFVLFINVWYPSQHAKLDIRNTLLEVNALKGEDDVILVRSPLVFFETIYYSNDKSDVYLYNPQGVAFPWYVGDVIVSPSQMVSDFPPYPTRAFVINEDATFEMAYYAPISALPKSTRATP